MATSSGQTFESYFAFSATAGSGLGANLAVDPLPIVASFEFAPSTEPGATPGQRRIALQLTAGAPLGTLLIEVSTDLGLTDPWKAVRALTLDAAGAFSFEEVIDFGPAGAASGFIRLCRPWPAGPLFTGESLNEKPAPPAESKQQVHPRAPHSMVSV